VQLLFRSIYGNEEIAKKFSATRSWIIVIGKSKVTAFEIAKIVGVSQPTVSRALRGDSSVSEATRKRVIEVAAEMKYSVDLNASRLRTQRTDIIALVIICREGEDRANVNPFYLSLLGCIAAAAADQGYTLIVSFQGSSGPLFSEFEDSRQADGIIVIGSGKNTHAWEHFAEVGRQGKAIVGWTSPQDGMTSYASDNFEGGRLATEHLIVQGRRKIVFVGPVETAQRQFEERRRGYIAALSAHNIEPIIIPVIGEKTREQEAFKAVAALCDSGIDFDAIFGANDFIALGAMQCLQERAIAVPEAVAIVGFDGIRAGNFAHPTLSTIEQDYEAAGALLVRNLVAMIKGQEPDAMSVPVHLMVRQSSQA
jgi:DNA-binding LacI/PurR family transcriptional regulator